MVKSLNNISKKIGILEKRFGIRIESESEKYERERKSRFQKYRLIRLIKLVRMGENLELERPDYFEVHLKNLNTMLVKNSITDYLQKNDIRL